LAVLAPHARLNIVVILWQIDQEIRIVCRRIVIAIALSAAIYQGGTMVEFRLFMAEQYKQRRS
jgi:hypothetical protein